jgi:hypothetical protein
VLLFVFVSSYTKREHRWSQYLLASHGRSALEIVSPPKLSGAIASGTVERGQLSVHAANPCLWLPGRRTLQKKHAAQDSHRSELGLSPSLISSTVSAAQCKKFVLAFDETDLRSDLAEDVANDATQTTHGTLCRLVLL